MKSRIEDTLRTRLIILAYIVICASAFLLSVHALVALRPDFNRLVHYVRWKGEGDSDADLAWFIKLFTLVALWRVGLHLLLKLADKRNRKLFGRSHRAVICAYCSAGIGAIFIISIEPTERGSAIGQFMLLSEWAYPLRFIHFCGICLGLVVPLALGAGVAGRYFRKASRIKHNRCLECAYDLRGLDRENGCPECGWNRPGIECMPTVDESDGDDADGKPQN